jgi:protein-disulfide isomerase/plastocyanin
MEQKQLDEDDSFLTEEFIDEEDLLKAKPEAKPVKKTVKKKAPAKEAEPEVKITSVKEEPAKEPVPTTMPKDPWKEDEEESVFKEVSTWKAITGIMVVLLIVSLFTQGFNFASTPTLENSLSLSEAEQRAVTYVNTNLLQPPFVAEVTSSAEEDDLYKITLSVAGEQVDSYLTKDGSLFFPQGFVVGVLPVVQEPVDLAEPAPLPVEDVAQPMIGDPDAPVTIVEYSDFQCPFCAEFYTDTLPSLKQNYVEEGVVNLVFRDFPLDIHPEAQSAALAASCAGDQDKFWDYHDLLFENQADLGEESYHTWAKELDLDLLQFTECLNSGTHLAAIQQDFLDGQAAGITGTPAFFINGKLVSGAQPIGVFEKEIEAALAALAEPVEEPVEVAPEPVVPEVSEPATTTIVSLSAKKWLFGPQEVHVGLGDQVELTIIPTGLEFTFALPAFGVEQAVSGPTVVSFTASQAGSFPFTCSSCEDWRGMTGMLVVE